ncbi:EF-Hand 1, calcium-binding site [Phytophthora cactorum]|nr:EF-Hand 1, calcium-binding site [Phytophthora cactorum]
MFTDKPYSRNFKWRSSQAEPATISCQAKANRIAKTPSIAEGKDQSSNKSKSFESCSSAIAQQQKWLDSASEREVDQAENTEDDGPHAQFKRQEHHKYMRSPGLRHCLAFFSNSVPVWKRYSPIELSMTHPVLIWTNENSNELSWDQFLERCEYSYLRLMSEGLIQPDAVATDRGDRSKIANDGKSNYQDGRSQSSAKEIEAQTIRRVFALLDSDGNGVVDVAEVQRTLYNSTVITPKSSSGSGAVSTKLRALVEGSRALQPMLHQELFMTAFTKFEPMDPRGISEEEFVAFCLEIAQVAAANNMMATVG